MRKLFTFGHILAFLAAALVLLPLSLAANYDFAGGQTSTGFYNAYNTPSDFTSLYSFSNYGVSASDYWPSLQDQTTCFGRQDLLIQVAPAGCQPVVVRSDLLAQQNVPVMCQLQALQINPLVDIRQLSSISFKGNYPDSVGSVGYHPARAALLSTNRLLGSPLTDNIGYVVVILKRNPKESTLPDFVNFTLSARVEYSSQNSLGIGQADFLLTPMDDETWNMERFKQTFWQGRYFIRLEQADDNAADVSIYYQNMKLQTLRVLRSQSKTMYLPGMYCQAGLQISYNGYRAAETKAIVEFSDNNGTDTLDLYRGSKIFDACTVDDMRVDESGSLGNLTLHCSGYQYPIQLKLSARGYDFTSVLVTDRGNFAQPVLEQTNDYTYFNVNLGSKGNYSLRDNNQLYYMTKTGWAPVSSAGNSLAQNKQWLAQVQSALVSYKTANLSSPDDVLFDRKYDNTTESAIQDAIAAYERVADLYPNDKATDIKGTDSYGELALANAIDLLKTVDKPKTQIRLINKFLDLYPKSDRAMEFTNLLTKVRQFDASGATASIPYNGRMATLRLVGFESPAVKPSARVIFSGLTLLNLQQGKTETIAAPGSKTSGSAQLGSVTLDQVYADHAEMTISCMQQTATGSVSQNTGSKTYQLDESIKSGANPTTYFRYQASLSLWQYSFDQSSWASITDTIPLNIGDKGKVVYTALKGKSLIEGQTYLVGQQATTVTASTTPLVVSAPSTTEHLSIKVGEQNRKVCGNSIPVTLDQTTPLNVAQIHLTPVVQGTQSDVNFTVAIGIEKRSIQLSPNKTQEMILNINQSIARWQSISDKLGTVVTTLKGACFATSAILMAKNFLTGLSGESLARQQVMRGTNGWSTKCKESVSKGDYPTLDACYLANSKSIEDDVKARTSVITKVNGDIHSIESQPGVTTSGGLLEGNSVNRESAAKLLADKLRTEYPNTQVTLSNGQTLTVSQLLSNPNGYKDGEYTYDQLRDLYANILLKQSSSPTQQSQAQADLTTISTNINQTQAKLSDYNSAKKLADLGMGTPTNFAGAGQQKIAADVVKLSDWKTTSSTARDQLQKDGITNTMNAYVSPVGSDNKGRGNIPAGKYVLGLQRTENGEFVVKEVIPVTETGDIDQTRVTGTPADAQKYYQSLSGQFTSAYSIGTIVAQNTLTYYNKYTNPEIKYYDNGAYKGQPAVVPFDTLRGWYVATKQTLPLAGQTSAFQASGQVSSFWLCNVGPNGMEQFLEGMGDDICQLFNLNTGQSESVFPGLDAAQTKTLVSQAIAALSAAQQGYGSSTVRINGQTVKVGKPATSIPTAQCQDFMSPKDCNLMFNVCDPVICPASRCDFGGKYPVADVVQTGIIGSTLLCLPNIREKIYIPVCLTGIKAGIDGFISILQSHRDCLQQSLNTGEMVGICDQIYSIYLCEFFWKQAAPLVNILLPKLIEMAYTGGQSSHGGGEYLTVMGAWDNMQKSLDYFKTSYAGNAFKAFQIRSVEEAGTEFCQVFISAKAPTAIKNLLTPDSPPQFHAWFSSSTFSDATVPATSQYKVYYHIFAGQDSGIYYQVYLKSPPDSPYYYSSPTYQVAGGFVNKGETADQTKDFTAPSGYKQLCVRVNGQEECGFGQVSTSFAVNYLSDQVVNDAATTSGIISQSGCISGSSPSLSGLTSTNPQAALTNTVVPQVSNMGIVRICSTQNPAVSTNPARYVDVGYCDDAKVRCWLDKQSVSNAISVSDVGTRNDTLSQLAALQKQTSIDANLTLDDVTAANQLSSMQDNVKKMLDQLSASSTILAAQVDGKNVYDLLDAVNALYNQVWLNTHKAALLVLKGQLRGGIAQVLVRNAPSALLPPTASASTSTSTPVVSAPRFGIKTDATYAPGARMEILSSGVSSGLVLYGSKVYALSDLTYTNPLGAVTSPSGVNTITLFPAAQNVLTSSSDYSALNGATIGTSIQNGYLPLTASSSSNAASPLDAAAALAPVYALKSDSSYDSATSLEIYIRGFPSGVILLNNNVLVKGSTNQIGAVESMTTNGVTTRSIHLSTDAKSYFVLADFTLLNDANIGAKSQNGFIPLTPSSASSSTPSAPDTSNVLIYRIDDSASAPKHTLTYFYFSSNIWHWSFDQITWQTTAVTQDAYGDKPGPLALNAINAIDGRGYDLGKLYFDENGIADNALPSATLPN